MKFRSFTGGFQGLWWNDRALKKRGALLAGLVLFTIFPVRGTPFLSSIQDVCPPSTREVWIVWIPISWYSCPTAGNLWIRIHTHVEQSLSSTNPEACVVYLLPDLPEKYTGNRDGIAYYLWRGKPSEYEFFLKDTLDGDPGIYIFRPSETKNQWTLHRYIPFSHILANNPQAGASKCQVKVLQELYLQQLPSGLLFLGEKDSLFVFLDPVGWQIYLVENPSGVIRGKFQVEEHIWCQIYALQSETRCFERVPCDTLSLITTAGFPLCSSFFTPGEGISVISADRELWIQTRCILCDSLVWAGDTPVAKTNYYEVMTSISLENPFSPTIRETFRLLRAQGRKCFAGLTRNHLICWENSGENSEYRISVIKTGPSKQDTIHLQVHPRWIETFNSWKKTLCGVYFPRDTQKLKKDSAPYPVITCIFEDSSGVYMRTAHLRSLEASPPVTILSWKDKVLYEGNVRLLGGSGYSGDHNGSHRFVILLKEAKGHHIFLVGDLKNPQIYTCNLPSGKDEEWQAWIPSQFLWFLWEPESRKLFRIRILLPPGIR